MFSGSVCGFIHVFFLKSRCRPTALRGWLSCRDFVTGFVHFSVFVRFLDECWDGLNGLIVGFGVVKLWNVECFGNGFWRGLKLDFGEV